MAKPKKQEPIVGVSSGSTLLNLAVSGRPDVCYLAGKYSFLVGDSTSGKTFLSLSCFAEMANDPRFDDYRFLYDDVEGGNLFDVRKMFGPKTAQRIEPAGGMDGDMPVNSSSIEDFYSNVHKAIEDGRPFVYVLDSQDGLTSDAEVEKTKEQREAHEKGKQAKGSYGDGKAKIHSANLRRLMQPLQRSGSILIVISQTRDNIGFGFEQKTRSGGRALQFYATVEIWSSVAGRIKKQVGGKPRIVGITSKIQVKKNRITGVNSTVEIPIYHSYGIDDTGSCVDYLVDEGYWKKRGQRIIVPEFGEVAFTRERLIQKIEGDSWENELRALVGKVWKQVEDGCKLDRKPRYE